MSSEGPDQCWSWVIAMSAFFINFLLSGLSRAVGVIYLALIDDYGVSRFEANLPFTMRNCVRNLAGPVVGMIGQRYGVQEVTLVGGVLASLGVSLCYIAPNVFWISIFWGGLHGLGVALANTLFQVTVNQYFVKYRATAAGLALSGACIGSFILPIILEVILNNYGLAGTFLISGGIVMHILPPSIFLKEPKWLRKGKAMKRTSHPVDHETKNTRLEIQDTHIPITTPYKNDWSTVEVVQTVSIRKLSWADSVACPEFLFQLREEKKESLKAIQEEPWKELNGVKTISSGKLEESQLPNQLLYKENENSENTSVWRSLLKLHMNPMFHLISLTLGIFSISFDPVATVIMDYSKDKGLDAHVGKYFVSVLAFGDLIGRMCFGWVTDRGFVTLPKFVLMLQVIQGICFTLMPLFSNFEVLLALIVVYGVCAGNTLIMIPILVGKYLANEQSLAIGCIAFFSGIMSFSVPPLIGHFRDDVGSYDGMFYITGGLSIFSGLIWLLEPWLVRLNPYRTKNNTAVK